MLRETPAPRDLSKFAFSFGRPSLQYPESATMPHAMPWGEHCGSVERLWNVARAGDFRAGGAGARDAIARHAAESVKRRVELHLVIAFCSMRQGHHAEALRELDEAVRLLAWRNAGRAHQERSPGPGAQRTYGASASVAEVAASFGFRSITTFALEYRKRFGVPPSHTCMQVRAAKPERTIAAAFVRTLRRPFTEGGTSGL
jgi:AraC-like DNA-binding protein